MADAEYRVWVGVDGDTAGAAKVEDALKRVGDQAKSTGEAVAAATQPKDKVTRLDDILAEEKATAALGDVQKRVKDDLKSMAAAEREGTESTRGLGEQLARAGDHAKTFKDGLEVANGSLRQLPGLMRDAADGGDAIGSALAKAGVIAGAAIAGWKLGTLIREQFEALDSSGDDLKERAAAIQEGLQEAASRNIVWDGLLRGADQAIAKLDALQARIDMIDAAEKRRLKAETGAAVAAIDERAAKDSASAPTDEARAAIKARAEKEKAVAEANARVADITSSLNKAIADRTRMEEKAQALNEKLFEMQQEQARLQEKVNNLLELKIAAGESRADAIASPDVQKAKADLDNASERMRKEMAAGGHDQQSQDLAAKLDAQYSIIAALQAELAQAKSEFQTKSVELGSESQRVLSENLRALAAAEQRLTEASAARAAAQAAGDVPGQTATQAAEQQAMAEVQRLEAAVEQARANVADGQATLGEAAAAFGIGVKSAAEEAAAKVNDTKAAASAQLKESADKHAADLQGATGQVTEAMNGSTAQIAGAVQQLGTGVSVAVRDLKTGVVTAISSVRSDIEELNTRLRQNERSVADVQSQLKAGR